MDNQRVPLDQRRPLTYWTILRRSWRLRCPMCGLGHQFDGLFKMRRHCACCGYSFEREPGYFLGSIYINYGLTALAVTAGYFIGFFAFGFSSETLLLTLTAFSVLFPIWFFRYARSLWMGFDTFWDPVPDFKSSAPGESISRPTSMATPTRSVERD